MASANIVGYSQNALQDGFKESGASFMNIGGTGCNLTDLVPVGIGDKSLGVIGVHFLDASGKMTANYGYYKGGTGKRATEGWYQGITLITAENNAPIPAGSGIWVQGATGLGLTFKGPCSL